MKIVQVFDVSADDLSARILLFKDGSGWKTETRFSAPRGHAHIWRMQVDEGETPDEALGRASLSAGRIFEVYDEDVEYPRTVTMMHPYHFISPDDVREIWGPDYFIQEAQL